MGETSVFKCSRIVDVLSYLGLKVKVYWNSHKKTFSIKYKNKVIGWSDQIYLTNCKFTVSKSGVDRIRKNKKKTVCATVEGNFMGFYHVIFSNKFEFNPYYSYTFYDSHTNLKINEAKFVSFLVKDKRANCYYKV